MYQFGQFLGNGNNIENYLTDLTSSVNITDFQASLVNDIYSGNEIVFTNKIIKSTSLFTSLQYYYLKFKIQTRDDSSQIFYLKLQNVSDDSRVEKEQFIKTFTVPQDISSQNNNENHFTGNFVLFEVVIAPNSSYNQLNWEMQRTNLDYTIITEGDINGRIANIEIESFGIITNQISNQISPLSKIGIQGRPSLLMCINGEQIRIGKSGVYEINNSIPIVFAGFIPNENDYFIVDYEYGEED